VRKWSSIRVTAETQEAIKFLADQWGITTGQVVERLLELYSKYLQGDNEAKALVTEWANKAAQASEDRGEGIAVEATAQSLDEQVRDAVSDLLYLTDAVIEVLFTITSVYPDLRAECGPLLDRVARRFSEVAEAWGVWQPPQAAEEAVEEAAGQEAEGSEEGQEEAQLVGDESA